MSHKQQYEASDLDYGTESFRTAETGQNAAIVQWNSSPTASQDGLVTQR
jgi:hypothetical protein